MSASEEKKVLWVELSEPITPGSAEKVSAAVQEASSQKYNAILITLDTLGGSADSTFKIIDSIQSSSVPVIGYVYPLGRHAWSAGTIILEASDLAAMAPYTVIGSSQPVIGTEPTNESKIVNAIVGKLDSLSELHGRNSTEVERFVTHNDNLTPDLALKDHVIEIIADSPNDLMSKANGMKVRTLHGEIVLDTGNATIVKYEPTVRASLLAILSDPIVSTMFLSIGILAIILGLSHPGFGAEVFGGVLLLLGLVGQGFDVNWAALVLMGIGAGLLVFELHVHGFGIVGVGGVIILAIGMSLLVAQPVQPMLVPTSYATDTIVTLSLMLIPFVALFGFLMFKAYKATRMKKTFTKYPVGKGRAIDDISPEKKGYVWVAGEYWRAKSSTYIKSGTAVKIIGSQDGVLSVEPVAEENDNKDFQDQKKI
ncbi:MAG: nodulation protein NfeD [Thaumarchaeota archaeon]|nr:nodulation protein NfeD [Nitrososphaerota archaeon]